jgi:protease-4
MSSRNFFVRLISSIWRGVDGVRKILHLLLLVMLFLVFFGTLSGTPPLVPQKAALVVQPIGPLVDQLDGNAYDRALAELINEAPPQTLVQDIIDALAFAKTDDRISAVHLELSGLSSGGLSKLRRIGVAIDDFKESGKPVVASADYFSQSGYHLAAHADELYMHPEGMLFLQGYGGFRSYYKEAIDKLRVDWNVFRVGTHKSFVEPYTRMDMSPQVRESLTHLIQQFWSMYQEDVESARGLEDGTIDDFAQNLLGHVEKSSGDMAIAAREAGLIDKLLSRAELRAVLREYVGEDSSDSTHYSSVGSFFASTAREAAHLPRRLSPTKYRLCRQPEKRWWHRWVALRLQVDTGFQLSPTELWQVPRRLRVPSVLLRCSQLSSDRLKLLVWRPMALAPRHGRDSFGRTGRCLPRSNSCFS